MNVQKNQFCSMINFFDDYNEINILSVFQLSKCIKQRQNKYIRHIYFMHKQSLCIGNYIIGVLDKEVWKKIAQKNIQKMVPINIEKMNNYTFQSLAQLNSSQLQSKDYVKSIGDKKNLGRDNLLHNYIRIQRQISNNINNNSKISQARGNIQRAAQSGAAKKMSNLNNNSMLSSGRQDGNQVRSKNQKNDKFIQLQSYHSQLSDQSKGRLHTIHNGSDTAKYIQGLRNKIIFIQQAKIKEENQSKLQQQQSLQRKEAMMKKKKQMQRISFDYDGQFFGSKNPNPENTLGAAARVKSECNKDLTKAQAVKLEKLKPQFTKLINQKLEQRYRRIKSQNQETQNYSNFYKESSATRFANSLVNDDSMSQGVSIRQTTSNFFKQKPLNRLGEKLTLTQFKKQVKDKRFRQFRVKPVQSTNRYKTKKIVSYKSEQNFIQSKKNTIQVQMSQKKSQPADIQKRYITLSQSQHSILLSNSKISGNSSKFKSKGLVKISNPSLFSSVFHDSEVC